MKNVRFALRLTLAFLKRFGGVIFIGVVIGIFFFLLLRFISPRIKFNSTEKIGMYGRYQTDNLPGEILLLIGQGLTTLDESEIPQPQLAETWATSDRGKTWIFTLKDNLYWQDGEKVTSKSIVYEFSDVTIDRPDDRTIIFMLQKNAYSAFPAVVSKPTFKKGLLGTGEWKVKKINITGSYIQQLELESPDKNIKIYKFYPTVERTKLALKLGEVDKIVGMFDVSPFNKWNTVIIEKTENINQVVTLFFNNSEGPFADRDGKPLRQALAYAIDKRFLSEHNALGPVSPKSWAFNPQVKPYDYDPKKSKETIDDLPEEFKDNLEIKLVSSPILLDVAEKIAQDWERVGVKTNVLVSTIIPVQYDVFLTILDIPKDPDQYSVWHSTQKNTNYAKYNNPRIDKLLEDGRSQLDFEDRKKVYLDFQRFLLEDLPADFLYYPTYYSIKRK